MKKDKEIEEWLQALLKPDGAFDPPENLAENTCNVIRKNVLAEPDEDMREIMYDDLRTAIAGMVYGGHDPKNVPKQVMIDAIRHPHDLTSVFTHIDARKRVKNPNSGIRAMCLECQGNDQVGVRNCPSVNCFLWPFRAGGNPFYGRLIGLTGEEEAILESEAEIEAMEEDSAHADT